jgi:hypothetical protein
MIPVEKATILADLRAARALITSRAYAERQDPEDNRPVSVESADAARFCAMGALIRVAGIMRASACEYQFRANGYPNLTTLNDFKGHLAVLAAFDDVIARLEAVVPETAEPVGELVGV